jgi:aspartyl-tRNA(Asn)/glutamyl-tRNA(Gln) amidotransferase subunit B
MPVPDSPLAARVPDLVETCRKAVAENPKFVAEYKEGKSALLGFFVGCVMKASRGSLDPREVNEELLRQLNA